MKLTFLNLPIWLSSILFVIILLLSKELDAFEASLNGKLVFSTQHELWVINLDDEDNWQRPLKIELPYESDMAHHPEWMPDGENVLFEFTPWTDDINNMQKYFAVINIKSNKLTTLEGSIFDKNDNLLFPKWSPDGKLLAFLEQVRSEVVNDKQGTLKVTTFNKLIIFDKSTARVKAFDEIYASWSPISWSSDNKKIAYQTSDKEIAVYDLDNNNAVILDKGSYPVFHPKTNQIYYIASDTHLYTIDTAGKNRQKIDDSNWSWFSLIAISKDGNNLFYVGGGSFLMWEYRSIEVCNLSSHKKEKLSKKYGIIHGAALFEK